MSQKRGPKWAFAKKPLFKRPLNLNAGELLKLAGILCLMCRWSHAGMCQNFGKLTEYVFKPSLVVWLDSQSTAATQFFVAPVGFLAI